MSDEPSAANKNLPDTEVVEIARRKAEKSKKLRFSIADDVALLKEVPKFDRPFKFASKAWDAIAAKMTGRLAGVKDRTIRDRVILLVKLQMRGKATSQKQSVISC